MRYVWFQVVYGGTAVPVCRSACLAAVCCLPALLLLAVGFFSFLPLNVQLSSCPVYRFLLEITHEHTERCTLLKCNCICITDYSIKLQTKLQHFSR